MMRQKTLDKTKDALELNRKGTPIKDACKQLNLAHSSFVAARKILLKPKRKMQARLSVTDLPATTQQPGQLFMIYGSPSLLAEFTRTLQ